MSQESGPTADPSPPVPEAAPPAPLTPEERAARRQAREARIARREARETWERENPPEVRRLAKRMEGTGIEAETSLVMARYASGQTDGIVAPDVTQALTVAAVQTLLNAAHRFPHARALIEPLRQRILDAASSVHDWDSLRRALDHAPRDIGPAFDAMVARIRRDPDAAAAGVNDDTVDAWRQSARMGMIARLLAETMKNDPDALRAAMPTIQDGGARLRGIDPASLREFADPRGTLLVTVHNPHLGALEHASRAAFPDHRAVRADDLKGLQDARTLLLSMVRSLKRGGAGLLVPDGGFGRVDREVRIFGEPLPVVSGFARLAWISGCRVVFGVGSSLGRTQGLTFQATELPRRTDDDTDAEAYVNATLEAYAAAVRDAMVRFPFDSGLSHRLGKRAPADHAAAPPAEGG